MLLLLAGCRSSLRHCLIGFVDWRMPMSWFPSPKHFMRDDFCYMAPAGLFINAESAYLQMRTHLFTADERAERGLGRRHLQLHWHHGGCALRR